MKQRGAVKKIILWITGLLLAAALLGGFAVAAILRDLPSPEKLEERRVVESTKIYDRTGQILLYEIHGEEKRTVIPFETIPDSVKHATLALEDANFYQHGGIDFRGVARALFVDITTGNLSQGGSTITQQLVKSSILGKEKTLTRKFKEAVLAIILESRDSKDEILGLYLNQIPYGSNAYGIEAASLTYFGTSTEHISLAEAATLASLPRAPSYYSPYGTHVDELVARKNLALDRMAALGFITSEDRDRSRKEKINFLPQSRGGIRAPHFALYVRDILIEKYGEDVVQAGGLSVTTTLDTRLQDEAEKIVADGAEFNKKAIDAGNASLVAIDPKTGDILAMVGSKDYFGSSEPEGCTSGINCKFDPQVNVALKLRQPGSSFKPFVYATAFKKGYTPKTVLFDVPTEFNPLCSPEGIPESPRITEKDCYHPANYDETFRGPVTLRQAIAQSLNVPSVKLLYLAGVEDSMATARAMGITTLGDANRYGLSLVLGGAEVRLLDMASGYGVFATEGVRHAVYPILKVEAKGQILEEKRDAPEQVVDTEVAQTINDVLSDDDARVPVFQPHGSLWLPDRPVAAKTGTTQEYRDAWAVGYTPSLVVGVWAGNNDNTPIKQKGSGVLAAAPIWNKFMRFATANTLPEFFTKPEDGVSEKPVMNGLWQGEKVFSLDRISGKLATALTPDETKEDRAYGDPRDPLFWIQKGDPLGAPPQNPFDDPQYKNWEAAFQKWLAGARVTTLPLSAAPAAYDDVHTPENQPRVAIDSLTDEGNRYTITLRITAKYPVKEVDAIANDALISSVRAIVEGKAVLVVGREALGNPPANILVKVYDTVGNKSELTIPFSSPQ